MKLLGGISKLSRHLIVVFGIAITLSLRLTYADEGLPASSEHQMSLAAVFGEDVLADDVFGVRQSALELEDSVAYQQLYEWVLPSASRGSWRMISAFREGEMISPASDLVKLAARQAASAACRGGCRGTDDGV